MLGPVFRTYEPSRDRLVAVKVFRLDLLPEQAQALAAELDRLVARELAHPSIVARIAAGIEGHVVYLAEEYVAAESLDIALRHYAPAPLETALPFLRQLAGAIDTARAAGVGHGALHPRDIFLTPEEARATGFGVVDALERVGLRAPVRRPYSAPERVAGAPWGIAADVFTLGAVAHELLTGRRPAGTGEVAGIAGRAAESHPELQRAVLARALAEAPEDRFRSAVELVDALADAAEGRAAGGAVAGVPAAGPVEPAGPDGNRTLVVELDEDAETEMAGDLAGDAPSRLGDGLEEVEDADTSERDVEKDEPEPALEPEPEPEPVVAEPVAPERPLEPALRDEPSLFDLDDALPAGQPEPEIWSREMASGIGDEVEEEPAAAAEGAEEAPPIEGEPSYEDEPVTAEDEPVAERVADDEWTPAEAGVTAPPAERAHSPILPYAAMLIAGLLAGFVAGYSLGSRERAPEPPASATAPPPAAAPAALEAPAKQTWSEASVESRPKAPPPSAAAPAAVPEAPPVPPQASEPKPAATPPRAAPARPEPARPAPAPSRSVPARPRTSAPARPPAAAPGHLRFDTRPRGARVFLDGRMVGVTPLERSEPPGLHQVRFELDGYRSWTMEVNVVAGETARVTGSLERVRR